jgi:protein-S-isoprenylcysteine O-methyltransferase Ste14
MNSENAKGHLHDRHAGRDDLTGEHRLGDTLQLVFLAIFLAVWISDTFFLRYSTFLSGEIHYLIRFSAGTIILVFAGILARRGLRRIFGEVRRTPHVVDKGVFAIVRHPIYLGSILTYLGLLCFSLSIASAAVWAVIIVFYWFISRYEEKLLIKRFGEEYLEYRKKVPMLFPLKLSRHKATHGLV